MMAIRMMIAVVGMLIFSGEVNAGQMCYAVEFSQALDCASRRCGNRDIACEQGDYNIGGVKYEWMCGCSVKGAGPKGNDFNLGLDNAEVLDTPVKSVDRSKVRNLEGQIKKEN